MPYRYAIHPSIGVARVGNSKEEFYLAPESIGGLPIEWDAGANDAAREGGAEKPVTQFKSADGTIKRQAARFKVFRYDADDPNDPGTEVTAADREIKRIEWTVHLANKKGVWWGFAELQGNLMLGEWLKRKEKGRNVWYNTNSYEECMKRHDDSTVSLRNASVTGEPARQKLITDPGPRTVRGANAKRVTFSRNNIPPDYPHGSFPPQDVEQGWPINTLGSIQTDAAGRLIVLGGYGLSGGSQPITSYAGADTWNDDISDGPVTCTLTLKGGETQTLDAWVVVGSPKFAPELVNIVSLDDIMFDVGVRFMGLVPTMYDPKTGWNKDFVANYKRDIEPIIRRPMDSLWVANLPSMAPFFAPPFNTRDNSEASRQSRETYFSYFRLPGEPQNPPSGPSDPHGYNFLWSGDGNPETNIPMMPLQSGSNSVWNYVIEKFLTLTDTQYFLLGQWAAGKFTNDDASTVPYKIHPLDQASVGNCVGGPMCPGIEVTWLTREPPIYREPYRIRHRFGAQAGEHYRKYGLSTTHDETTPEQYLPPGVAPGCEPGDLTKRMAIPWQADFFQCTAQWVNFTNPDINKDPNHIPIPPTYFAYWWPPQSPMYVLSSAYETPVQQISGAPSGFQVYFPRGINSFTQMIQFWSYLGFIVNQNTGPSRRDYPYFVEKERAYDKFRVTSVVVGGVSNVINPQDSVFWQQWYLKDEDELLPVEDVSETRDILASQRRRIRPPVRGNQRHSEYQIRRKP